MQRMSAWTKAIPAALSRARFSSDPRRRRLSSATISFSGQSFLRDSARLEPTKPAPPVIQMQSCMSSGDPFVGCSVLRAMVIAARQMLFQPEVQHDEQIPASHFLELELGDAG